MYRNGALIDGAGPALVKKIFDDLGVTVEFPQTGTWDEVQAKARTGEVDMLVAAYKTTEREGYMVYSDPLHHRPGLDLRRQRQGVPLRQLGRARSARRGSRWWATATGRRSTISPPRACS